MKKYHRTSLERVIESDIHPDTYVTTKVHTFKPTTVTHDGKEELRAGKSLCGRIKVVSEDGDSLLWAEFIKLPVSKREGKCKSCERLYNREMAFIKSSETK